MSLGGTPSAAEIVATLRAYVAAGVGHVIVPIDRSSGLDSTLDTLAFWGTDVLPLLR